MLLAVTVLTLFLGVGGTAWGTQCGPQPACAVVRPESVVFVGRFLDPGSEWSAGRPERPARLEVVEDFAGLDPDEDEVRIEGILPWINPQGLWLITAVRKKENRAFRIDFCGNTGPLTDHQEELDYLRRRSRGETITRISGSVEVFGEPLGGVEVIATTPGGLEYRTTSNAQGDYELTHVAPGEYSMRLELSETQGKLYHPAHPNPWEGIELPGDQAEPEVAPGSCAGVFFELDHNGEVSGRLLEDNGEPASRVPVQLVSAEDVTDVWVARSGVSDIDGSFRLAGVNPGRYWLGVNINRYDEYNRSAPYRAIYHPGVATEEEAQVIEITEAEKVQGLELKLPPRRTPRFIEITVVGPDGTPIEGANIADAPTGDHDDAYYSVSSTAKTDSEGRIEIKAAAGLRYAIVALKGPEGANGQIVNSRGLVIPPGVKPLTILLTMERGAAAIDCGDDSFLDDTTAGGTATCDKLPAEERESEPEQTR